MPLRRLRLFVHLWRVFGMTTALDFWLLRCPRCHEAHDPHRRCIVR
jgi:hypothetical protein